MAKWINAVITLKGQALLSKLQAGETLLLTKAMSGSGVVNVNDLQNQTDVSNAKQIMQIESASINGSTAIIGLKMTNIGLASSYQLSQIGLYATDPDEGEILYFLAQSTSPDVVPSESESPGYVFNPDINIAFSNASSITVEITPYDFVTHGQLDAQLASFMNKSTYDTNGNGVVDKAEKLNVARLIALSGAVSGSASFDGSGNVTIATTLANLSAALVTSGTMSPARIAQDANNRFMTDSERTKLQGIATSANNYVHPSTHSPSIITQDANNRFVTDAEKSTWNGKANNLLFSTTISTGGWSGSYPWFKSISVTGILSTDNPIIDVVLSSTVSTARLQLEAWSKISRITTSDNLITVYCYDELPVTAIPIQIKVVR